MIRKMEKVKKSDERLSYLRAVATIAIVFLHTAFASVLTFSDKVSVRELSIANSINNITMWAVPCFVMITGSLLLDKERHITYGKLFKKYILRIVVLLISFSLIYRFFDVTMAGEVFNIDEILLSLKKMATATGWSHLWYLYMLISLYLMLPIYKKFVQHSNRKDIAYFLVLNLVFLSLLPMLKYWDINLGFYIQITTIYTFYLIGGYAIYKGIVKINKTLSYLLFILGLGVSVFITFVKWQKTDLNLDIFNNYFSLVILLQAICLFNIVVNSNLRLPKVLDKILLSVDKHSMGIYLIHMIFIRYIFKYTSFNPFDNIGISFLLVVGIIIASYVVAFILKKLPLVKNYI